MMIGLLAILWLLGPLGPCTSPAFRRAGSPIRALTLIAVPTFRRVLPFRVAVSSHPSRTGSPDAANRSIAPELEGERWARLAG